MQRSTDAFEYGPAAADALFARIYAVGGSIAHWLCGDHCVTSCRTEARGLTGDAAGVGAREVDLWETVSW